MRVLHLYGGIDRPESQTNIRLKQQGIDITVMCEESAMNQDVLRDIGIPIHHFNCKHRVDLKAISAVRKVLRSETFDLVHAFTSRTLSVGLFATSWLKPQPKVIGYRGAIGNVRKWDPTSWLTYFHPRVAAINCVSEGVRDYLLSEGISEKKALTLYKGHDVAWYDYEGKEPKSLTEFGVPEGSTVVGCVANMRRTKGVDLLLKAALELPRDERVHFMLVGEVRDPEIEDLSKDPILEGRVHFAGFRQDAPAFVRHFDIFVMPSRNREGLPKAVIEAMAQAKPCIVTAVGGMPELIRNGQEGYVVPSENIEELAKALLRFIAADPERRKAFGASAQARIQSDFHIDTTAKNMNKLYERVINHKQAA